MNPRSRPEARTRPSWLLPARLSVWLIAVVISLTALSAWLAISRHDAIQSGNDDVTADWLVTKAFADGIDPTTNLFDLATIYELDFWSGDAETRFSQHPRAPGSLLILYPMTWVGADQILPLILVIGAITHRQSAYWPSAVSRSSPTPAFSPG